MWPLNISLNFVFFQDGKQITVEALYRQHGFRSPRTDVWPRVVFTGRFLLRWAASEKFDAIVEGSPKCAVEVRSENDYGPAANETWRQNETTISKPARSSSADVDPIAETVAVYRASARTSLTFFAKVTSPTPNLRCRDGHSKWTTSSRHELLYNSRMQPIYLDYNATTPIDPAVLEAMQPYLQSHFGNPSKHARLRQTAHDAIDRARGQVATLIGAQPDEIVFTVRRHRSDRITLSRARLAEHASFFGRSSVAHIITSTIEHPATLQPCEFLAGSAARSACCALIVMAPSIPMRSSTTLAAPP